MKIRITQVLAAAYILLVFALLKDFSILPIIFFAGVLLADHFGKIRNGLKNLLYIMAGLSAFFPLLGVFLLYLPFAVFGSVLGKGSFIKNYIFGFVISFIPVNIIYLVTTYFSIPLNYPVILIIFYSLPLAAIFFLKRSSLDNFEIDAKESAFFFIVLIATTSVAIGIVNDEGLFASNGVRIFSRVQIALDGLQEEGLIPIYHPGIALGEPTFLWNTPSFKSHVAISNYLLFFLPPILFFNLQSFFILLLSTLGIGILFRSAVNNDDSAAGVLAISAASVLTGLSFLFLHLLESFKANYTYPMAYLFLALILDNPKRFREFFALMLIAAVLVTTHLPYGSGVLFIGASVFLAVKHYCIKDASELREFAKWLAGNKLKLFVTVITMLLLPGFYISAGFIFTEFLDQDTVSQGITLKGVGSDFSNFFSSFYVDDIRSFFSLKYPDVARIDDHKMGFFLSVLGPLSLLAIFAFLRSKHTLRFRLFAAGFALSLLLSSLFYSKITVLVGGFFRTNKIFILVLMGMSLVVLIHSIGNKYLKYALIAAISLSFLHAMPYAKQNIVNIHQEYFATGAVYGEEMGFISSLPNDGRILTYGVFNNVVDFGGNYLTGRYFSRNERLEFNIERNVFEKVHGQNSFGEPEIILAKNGIELSNYLAVGGYRYILADARHPISQHVIMEVSPSFARRLYSGISEQIPEGRPDFTFPIYQNGPLVIFMANSTNYAEKVELSKSIPESAYRQENGYRYVAPSPYHSFQEDFSFVENPKKPEPLEFERISETEVRITGNFEKGDFVVFKEQYFPRWKAFMGSREIPVMATNFELILLKTEKGREILLEYGVLAKEKVFGSLSLIAHLALGVLICLLIRKDHAII